MAIRNPKKLFSYLLCIIRLFTLKKQQELDLFMYNSNLVIYYKL